LQIAYGEIVQNEVSNNSNQQQNSLMNYDLEACNKNSQLGKRVRIQKVAVFLVKLALSGIVVQKFIV
ncbi:13647_t:CDS:1, partial [Racocetra persica]